MDNGLVVILGPTASGKSALAVKLARLFNGEIVSADSRQVYQGLDIGSGKITARQMRGVPHYLLDVANPKRRFSVARYQKLALKAVAQIQRRDKVPFLVGGTGLYIQSVVDVPVFPNAPPRPSLRARLEKKSAETLLAMLENLDPVRAAGIDPKNPRRLIRAIEIVKTTGRAIPALRSPTSQSSGLQIGIKKSPQELKKLIAARLKKRINGIVTEVKKLRKSGLSFKRLEELGLEYRFAAQYLQRKVSRPEMLAKIQKESEHFAKRQMTWFKRDKRIRWISTEKQAEKLLHQFLA